MSLIKPKIGTAGFPAVLFYKKQLKFVIFYDTLNNKKQERAFFMENKTLLVQKEMMLALKNKDSQRKDTLSILLAALKGKAKDKRADLTEAEENEVILKEIKQTTETMESAPSDRTDIIEECKARIAVLSEFAPKQMSEDEIREVVQNLLRELGIEAPSAKDKGVIMKNLMPKVNGKADGGVVNKIVSSFLK